MRRPSEAEHSRIGALAEAEGAPPPPARPVAGECCDRFCDPCVWDYYTRALERWAAGNGLADSMHALLAEGDAG